MVLAVVLCLSLGVCEFAGAPGSACDGSADDTQTLQAALTSCAASRTAVVLGPGARCTAGPLLLPSHTPLAVDGRLTARDRAKWGSGGVGPHKSVVDFLTSKHSVNLTLTGAGVIDGQGAQWWPKLVPVARPKLLLFWNASHVLLERLTFLNPPFYAVDIGGGGHGYVVRGVKVRAPNFQTAPNTDGIDIAATDVLVQDCDISNGDDSLCIKAPAHNVTVENSFVSQGNGLVLGTISGGQAISNITFRNISANDTTFGCHVKARADQTGSVSDVLFEDVRVFQSAAASIRRITHGDWPGYAIGIHQTNQGRRRLKAGATGVAIANVTFRRITGDVLHAGSFKCPDSTCAGIVVEDVSINASESGCAFSNAVGRSAGAVLPASCVPPALWQAQPL